MLTCRHIFDRFFHSMLFVNWEKNQLPVLEEADSGGLHV